MDGCSCASLARQAHNVSTLYFNQQLLLTENGSKLNPMLVVGEDKKNTTTTVCIKCVLRSINMGKIQKQFKLHHHGLCTNSVALGR